MKPGLNEALGFSNKINKSQKNELRDIIKFYFDVANENELDSLKAMANKLREKYYGRKIYFRGLLEFSNYCKNDCYYCGIRKSNLNLNRYRLTEEEILDCCKTGHDIGLRTFVIQSGEDNHFSDDLLCSLVSKIKNVYPDCAVTLSVGERSYTSYQKLYNAGTDRYLLRHETADQVHYGKLHPSNLSLANRKRCLYDLKEIGYQVGAGFMVGSPFQTIDTLAEDLVFLRDLNPHMIGIGPFIPHKDTPFRNYPVPSVKNTLVMLSLIRILLPKVLLPATTALGTIDNQGREKGLQAGANVVMPNLSPIIHRKDYALYDNKICTNEEAVECLPCLCRRIIRAGFTPNFSRGDHLDLQ